MPVEVLAPGSRLPIEVLAPVRHPEAPGGPPHLPWADARGALIPRAQHRAPRHPTYSYIQDEGRTTRA